MSRKPEPTYPHSSLYHALNAVEQSCLETRLMWVTSSLSAKAEQLENMAQVIAHAIAQLEANLEQHK